MKNNANQYYIYLRSSNQRVAVTKEQFDDYYRDINAYRRTQQNHGRCVCPPSKRLLCDMDCFNCPYRTDGDVYSLDDNLCFEDGKEMNRLDYLQLEMPELQTPSNEDIVADTIYMQKMLDRLSELMPQAIEIGCLRQQGLSEDTIADRIRVGRKTYAYRLKKVADTLKKEFPDFF